MGVAGRVLGEEYERSRDALQVIASHVLSRAQHASTGRIGLRAAPGGFATIHFGPHHERLRVSGGVLVREVGGPTPQTSAITLSSSLGDLAEFAGVEFDGAFSVGDDTPPLGDVSVPLPGVAPALRALDGWFGLTARALDITASEWGGNPSIAQLWPEHFDLALDLAVDHHRAAEHRVNLGGSAGDGFHALPYLYVGPWTSRRPGDPAWWNAPFGAVVGFDDVMATDDPVATAVSFFGEGVARLRADW